MNSYRIWQILNDSIRALDSPITGADILVKVDLGVMAKKKSTLPSRDFRNC